MPEFSKEKYATIVSEIRDRILSAEILANEKNRVFIESTSLQIRKILGLIAYLSTSYADKACTTNVLVMPKCSNATDAAHQ